MRPHPYRPFVLPALALVVSALVGPAGAQDERAPGPPRPGTSPAGSTLRARWVSLERVLDQAGRGASPAAVQWALDDLIHDQSRWEAQQADIDRRHLPEKARARQAHARAAYTAGQGRLVELLRALAASGADSSERPAQAAEAAAIVARLEQASRPEPISAAAPRVFAPAMQAPALRAPAPSTLASPANDVPAAPDSGLVAASIRDQAALLEGPAAVYDWVRNQIRPDFYYGTMRGSLQAFLQGRGNDADTAAVLVEMMRAKGIPARYVRGTVEVTASALMRLTGTTAIEQAVRVLERAGIPHQLVPGTGGVAAVRLERVWVEAYVPYANYRGTLLDAQGKVWVPLDAAFKPLEAPRGFEVRALGFAPRTTFDDYLREVRSATPLASVRTRITALLAEQRPGTTYDDALNRRLHLQETLGLLPSSLPYTVIDRGDVGYDPPADLQHVLKVVGEGAAGPLFSIELPVSRLAGRRLTLAYAPFSDEDRAVVASYGGMSHTPPYLFEVRPLLKLDGQPVISADAALGMAVAYTLWLEMKTPSVTLTVSNRALAGNLTVIGLGGRTEAPAAAGETAAQILDSVARTYFQRWNDSDEELANLLRVAPVRPTLPACLASSDIAVEHAGGDPELPTTFEWKGALIDADLRASAPVAIARDAADSERDFMLLSGLEGSVLEDRAFSDGLGVPAVSTASALGLAASQGLTIHELTAANAPQVVPGLLLDPSVKEEVLDATARGLTVRLPETTVTQAAWTGVGYLLLDEETGASAWQLQGGHSGGVTVPAVLDWPRQVADPLLAQGEDTPPAPEGAQIAFLAKFGSADFQIGTVNRYLPLPLRVLVTDQAGRPVEGGRVTFRVLGGGGTLADPVTFEPRDELQVAADARGEASAYFLLGKKTDPIPRYLQFEGDEFATQAGMNVVTASAGGLVLEEPFFAFALPDDQFDGQNRYATLTNKTTPVFTAPLGSTRPITFDVQDPYGNPLSNIDVTLTYVPSPTQAEPPEGQIWLKGPTATPMHFVSSRNFVACRGPETQPTWGTCPGEAVRITARSSSIGFFAYAFMGDSQGSDFSATAGTLGQPDALGFTLGTWGYTCRPISPASCEQLRRFPLAIVVHTARRTVLNALGNAVEAYAVGTQAPVAFMSNYLIEEEEVIPEVQPDNSVRYRAQGTNRWRSGPLLDSTFTLSAVTAGTGVPEEPPVHVGGGVYASEMTMAPDPQRNKVAYVSKNYLTLPKYISQGSDGYIDPDYVNVGPPPTAVHVRSDRPITAEGSFSLWGVQSRITAFTPTPILLGANALVTRESAVSHEILPADYAALLDPRDVIFEVRRESPDAPPVSVLTAANTQPGGFRIPVGLPAPPGTYTGVLSIFGANFTATARLDSPPRPVPICGVVNLETPVVEFSVVRDPENNFACGREQPMVFDLCWDARVTIRVQGEVLSATVDDGPSVRIEELLLPAGRHSVTLPQALLGLGLDMRAPFTVDAATVMDPRLLGRAEGELLNTVGTRSITPVGHTFVKGVDLLDGHVSRSSVDFSLPGRHLGLEMSRGYSSTGSSAAGPMGAGWSWNYGGGLFVSDCGLVVVVTPSGDSQTFRSDDGGLTFKPQKGYHTRLVRNEDLSYDFFDKADRRHHFREPEDATAPNGSRRLEYVEEPHGDRIVVHYDANGRVKSVAELHPEEGEVRTLQVSYEKKGNADRIARIEIPELKIRVEYDHDAFGNLLSATRLGTNLDSSGEPARVEKYDYSVADALDRHQLLRYTGPNSDVVDYRYLAAGDTFLGEQAAALLQRKTEYAKEVREYPGNGRVQATQFEWDYRDAGQLRYRNTVRDGRSLPTLYVMDGRGSPLEIRDARGKSTFATWSPEDVLKQDETDANGRKTKYGYDLKGNLILETVETADLGLVTVATYAYHPRFNTLVQKTDGDRRTTRWLYDDATGDLLTHTDGAGNQTSYGYDEHGRMLRERSPRGFETVYSEHDSFGHPRRSEDPLGNRTSLAYDARGRLLERSDTLGHLLVNEWDAFDRNVSALNVSDDPDSDDQFVRTSYFAGGQPRVVSTPKTLLSNRLDGMNRLIGTTVDLGSQRFESSTQFDLSGNPEFETDRRGVTRHNTYDELNRLRSVSIVRGPDAGPTGEISSFDYDAVGNKIAETNVAGLRTAFDLDGLYRPIRRRLPVSGPNGPLIEKTDYDLAGNRVAVTDANDHTTHFTYDGLKRLVATENAAGQVNSVTYDDPEGSHVNKSEEFDRTRGLRTTFLYDPLNRETERTVRLEGANSAGQVYTTTTIYDDSTHSLVVADPRSTRTRRRLSSFDHVIEEIVDEGPDGLQLTTRTGWDGEGNRKLVVDPRQLRTAFSYDGLGRLTSTIDARGRETRTTYDGEGLKTAETDRRGVTRTFLNDNLGRLRLTTLQPVPTLSGVPWTQETRYLDRERKRVEIDARGTETTLDLDGLDRVVKATDVRSQTVVSTWDGVNKRRETDKRGATTSYDYDVLNRLILTRDPEPFERQAVSTTYEDALNKRTETDRRGLARVTLTDPLGRVVSISRAGVTQEEHAYDEASNRVTSRDAEGHTTRFAYDRANRLVERIDGFETPDQATTTFVPDEDGNVVDERDQRAADLGRPYSIHRGFDELNRLQSEADGAGHATVYDYDDEGHRRLVQQPLGQATTLSYDEMGALVEVRQPAPSPGEERPLTTYAYDPARNRLRQTDARRKAVGMGYDPFNRLHTMTQDPDGLALLTVHERDANGNETALSDPNGQEVASTYDALNRLATRSHQFAPDAPSPPWRYTTSIGYFYDGNANLTRLEQSLASTLSAPIGTPRASGGLDGGGYLTRPAELDASHNRFTFTGYEFDVETGLYYAKSRYYDPVYARFTTQDSVLGRPDDPPSLNRYYYGNANPVRYVDQTGHAAGDVWDPRTYLSRAALSGFGAGYREAAADVGDSLAGFGKGVYSAARSALTAPVEGQLRLDQVRDQALRGMAEYAVTGQTATLDALGSDAAEARGALRREVRTVVEAYKQPGLALDAATELGIGGTGQVVGGATFATALLVAPYAKGAPAVAVEGRYGNLLEALKTSAAGNRASRFAEHADSPFVLAVERGEAPALAPAQGRAPILGAGDLEAALAENTGVPDGAAATPWKSKYWSESEFQGNKVFQRSDIIDPTKVDSMGRTNLQRMEKGLAPLGPDNKPVNLHHILQTENGPIAELTQTFHQQNTGVVHINPSTIPSGIDRSAFNAWKTDYWKARAQDFAPK